VRVLPTKKQQVEFLDMSGTELNYVSGQNPKQSYLSGPVADTMNASAKELNHGEG